MSQQPPLARRPGGPFPGFLAGASRRRLQGALLAWYRIAGRPLRIRSTRDPWPVLVSEVMAQQTQIARVDEAWTGFMQRFPTPAALAKASAADVLRAWQGLGYNRRAVALQRAARAIVAFHGGEVPQDLADLEALPGVGPYTARAVAALAFGQAVAAVDTNVRRVLVRLVGADLGVGLGAGLGARETQALGDALVARSDPGAWTHAMMELGATVCRARRPECGACPVRRWCASADAIVEVPAPRRAPEPPFELTSRWLRGRLVAGLRGLEEGSWAPLPANLGPHGSESVAAAAEALRRDGLIERRADGMVRLPSGQP